LYSDQKKRSQHFVSKVDPGKSKVDRGHSLTDLHAGVVPATVEVDKDFHAFTHTRELSESYRK